MPDGRGVWLDPDELVTFNPPRFPYCHASSVDIVAYLASADMFPYVDENTTVLIKQGTDGFHPSHSPCWIFSFWDAAVKVLTLICIGRGCHDCLYGSLELRQYIQGVPAMQAYTPHGEFSVFSHDLGKTDKDNMRLANKSVPIMSTNMFRRSLQCMRYNVPADSLGKPYWHCVADLSVLAGHATLEYPI